MSASSGSGSSMSIGNVVGKVMQHCMVKYGMSLWNSIRNSLIMQNGRDSIYCGMVLVYLRPCLPRLFSVLSSNSKEKIKKKMYVPIKEFPTYNFIGLIIGMVVVCK